MRVRRIESTTDFEMFVEGYRAYGGPVPEARLADYFPHAEARAILGPKGRPIGGYLLAPKEYARCLQFVPDDVGRTIRDAIAGERACELTMVWLEPEYRGTAAAAYLWLHIAATLGLKANVDRILYATDVAKQGLVRLYGKISVGVRHDRQLLELAKLVFEVGDVAAAKKRYEVALRAVIHVSEVPDTVPSSRGRRSSRRAGRARIVSSTMSLRASTRPT